MNMIQILGRETGLPEKHVGAVIGLLKEGATIPFIARYRKEKTGSMDEVAIAGIRDRMTALEELAARKASICKSLEERELMTPSLAQAVENAPTLAALEDVYEKYRPKRRTRAVMAREKGLEPLAFALLFPGRGIDLKARPQDLAADFVGRDKDVSSVEEALAGAGDIMAEMVTEDPRVRGSIRNLFYSKAMVRSRLKKGKDEEGAKFKDYFDWEEPAFKAPSHRILAMLRGAGGGILTLHVRPEEGDALANVERFFIRKAHPLARDLVRDAIRDGYKRLLSKSMETECLKELKIRADQEAISVFTRNLEELLLASPLGEKRVLALDPGFRTGCKLVCLDEQGQLLMDDVIYPHSGRAEAAGKRVRDLVRKHGIQAIAVGNGTAGRETEAFVRELKLPDGVMVISTDESGASIYSASDIAREEFPDKDITVRGAVSIGRRLIDPLAELVKIDPKSIGVGQYQHDVDQKALNGALDDTVKSCVNRVGVEANTASRELLARVSGLNATIAANMVKHRNENGPFASRRAFLKVPRLGPKAYEQAAGFLRIRQGKNPLDKSGIHPESYAIVEKMAKDQGLTVGELLLNSQALGAIDPKAYITDTVGLPTLTDILKELARPGLDPREKFEVFAFDDTVHEIKDLREGMVLPGIVTNVTAFGAFVDVGVHQDGLVHISQLSNSFVKDPHTVVSVRQKVRVRVLEVDLKRRRISLSMKAVAHGGE
ncbi:MAG: RNA-binding transcriptional accessory protein [Desulfobacterales bacterium]|nr:RNA-binding transcriptional accessory protein [Desulfobacterales bacterium]